MIHLLEIDAWLPPQNQGSVSKGRKGKYLVWGYANHQCLPRSLQKRAIKSLQSSEFPCHLLQNFQGPLKAFIFEFVGLVEPIRCRKERCVCKLKKRKKKYPIKAKSSALCTHGYTCMHVFMLIYSVSRRSI